MSKNNKIKKVLTVILFTAFISNLWQSALGNTQNNRADNNYCQSCIKQASSLFASGQNKEAINVLQQAKNNCTNSSQFHLLFSTILARQINQSQDAENEAYLACLAEPNSIPCHLNYGLLLVHNQNSVKAIKEFEKVVALDSNNYEAWSNLANLYKQVHEDELAKKSQAKLSTLSQHFGGSDYYVYRNLVKQRKYDQARVELIKLIQATPATSTTFENLVKEAFKIGALEEAVNSGKKLLQVQPKSLDTIETVCLAELLLHHYSDCLESIKPLLAIEPNNANGLAIEGLAQLHLGYIVQARNNINSANKANSESRLVQLANRTLTSVEKNTNKQNNFDDELSSSAGLYQAKDPDVDLLDAN